MSWSIHRHSFIAPPYFIGVPSESSLTGPSKTRFADKGKGKEKAVEEETLQEEEPEQQDV